MEKIKITIFGNEKNKNEIIYNNIIDAMERMNLSKQEQIEYFKERMALIENNNKNKFIISILIACSLLLLCFGLYFMYSDMYLLGITLSLLSFIVVIWDLWKFLQKLYHTQQNEQYAQVEQLRKLLNMHLK